jgi:anti-sigma regulatory factor (Ser/Thr protein kinase)
MTDVIKREFTVDAEDFAAAGAASAAVKKIIKQLGFSSDIIRRVSIAMYEAEINMVIHANGGTAEAEIAEDYIKLTMKDNGPGIPDVDLAMQVGWSTATDSIRQLGFGAGMGLPNIEKYSDELKIDTQIGVGTTLTILIRT